MKPCACCCCVLCRAVQGKDATNFQGLSMFKRVHSMLQAVFRGRGLEVRAKGGSSDNITPQRGLLAFDVYAEVYKQCPGRAKRQKGEIAPQHLDPQDTTLAATFDRWVVHVHSSLAIARLSPVQLRLLRCHNSSAACRLLQHHASCHACILPRPQGPAGEDGRHDDGLVRPQRRQGHEHGAGHVVLRRQGR